MPASDPTSPDRPLNVSEITAAERREILGPAAPDRPLTALCISGGGIRSATFALGAIESMAEHGLLEQFDYLSTVSGGGYIGAWLTAWATRVKGIGNVVDKLRRGAPPPGPNEPDPIQHLRDYNSYLTPRRGGLSEDTWTDVATVVRNVALNWLVLIPLLLLFLMAPRLVLSLALLPEFYPDPNVIARSLVVTRVLPGLCIFLFCFALWHIWWYLPGVGGKDHDSSDFARRVLGPLILCTLLFCAFDSLYFWNDDYSGVTFWKYVLLTPLQAFPTWILFLLVCRKPWKVIGKLFLRLSLAIGLLSICLGLSEWVITVRFGPEMAWPEYVGVVPPLLGFSFFAALAVFAGLSSGLLEDMDREWLSRASAGILLSSVLWLAACELVLRVPGWVFDWNHWGHGAMAAAGAAAAWLAGQTPPSAGRGKPGVSWSGIAVSVGPPLFILALVIGLAMGTDGLIDAAARVACGFSSDPGFCPQTQVAWYQHDALIKSSPWQLLAAIALGFLALAWLMARFININRFSLHGMYRERLTRAYLGASNPDRFTDPDHLRDPAHKPNRFTGFAQSDNLAMSDLTRRPFHVVNVCLNLVAGKRLAWQQRKAESFTMTPLHCGNRDLGYRDSREYGDGMTLGGAITISGAAASPNMGYHSSPATGFIMTLLNARLGAWLGNPGSAGEHTWKHAGPRSAMASLVREAFGLTNNCSPYVYLSDGGHFENLALYEMVQRGCRSIVLLDGGCDDKFTYEDLGNALRKIRIDLNIPIIFEDPCMHPLRQGRRRCAVARIEYPDGNPGYLVYVKPLMLGDEPPDVASYAKAHPTFPHQSTADQWFDESQTESYRMLGKFTMHAIFADWKKTDKLADFAAHVANAYLQVRQAAVKTA